LAYVQQINAFPTFFKIHFRVVDIDKWQTKKYSLITALNLLDRIDHPVKLVNQLRASVRDDGLVLLAIVLPYNPCYETGELHNLPQ